MPRLPLIPVLLALLTLTNYPSVRADETSRYFSETGHTASGAFLSYWNAHGGLAQQGLPITEQYQEVNTVDGNSYPTQYFERARFEFHAESNDPSFKVLLGLLGVEAVKAKYPSGLPAGTAEQVVPGGGSSHFAATGYTVTGLFLKYWGEQGGLQQQGLPITPAFMERNAVDGKEYLTQYFERARFEYHPENTDPSFQVLLGLLGVEVYKVKQSPPATPTLVPTSTPPTPPTQTLLPAATPTPAPANACKYQVHPLFQFTVAHTSGLIERLGCPIDAGQDATTASHAGRQEFSKATLVLLDPGVGDGHVYLLKGNSYQRTGYQGLGGDDPDTGAGRHFSDAVRSFGGKAVVGVATSGEDITDGGVQEFEHGTLGYYGGSKQLCYAFFPDSPTQLDYGTTFTYPTR